jgi:TPR repeat protein
LEQRSFDRETIAVMVKRGSDLIDSGDLVAARIVLQRAAEAGSADAALALATTYDPAILRKLKVYGFAPDAAKARSWYEQARKFGSREAPN